ncbi:hypothetical protein N7499_000474 [Penicillium canescens]|uniref:Uncharacterized protein n=1 Tax=Penicillium canescens TaxID=5083 RepID=A0AAD6IHG9_PENCN|nr:uncharacterized protein N7446_011323 [Penicillium canescens]KAJ6029328.1 hypothetical protein N7444_012315 [Penicillium canescens]KAJ6047759.1 hypothetical protein N7460_003906 [Penicillium canescens]KAJ6048640.1 hypothetical protein N7446_011323 [Penicillium canescens]KAJ6100844.1 hypothetical protein N7499_000474 [Penicillium canescens]KAJ6173305.1 hypothetical protein N7485_006117 [Penicillium canescens]
MVKDAYWTQSTFGLTANINKTSVMDISATNIDLEHHFVDITVCDLDLFEDYWNEHDRGPRSGPIEQALVT